MNTQDVQRGYQSYGELTLNEIMKMAESIPSEWDGDESGRGEDRARAAMDLIEPLNKVIDIVIALKEEL